MLRQFYPDEYVDSTYQIDFEKYYNAGYRGVIFDIDNTLVPHDAPADERAVVLFERLKKLGFSSTLLSNNKEPRVKMFNEEIQVDYVYKAGKPKRAGYQKAMETLGTDETTTVFVGDQLFTDVWGAKRTGITSYLVEPIDKHEEIQIVLKRYLEKPILYCYQKKKNRFGILK